MSVARAAGKERAGRLIKTKKKKEEKKLALNIQTQQTRYTGVLEAGLAGGREGELISNGDPYYTLFLPGYVLLFPDFAIFAVPRVRQTKGKRHLNS